MKPLSLEEIGLKLEMKKSYFLNGKYISKEAEDKFKLICHMEDFEIEYWNLQQENKQLKDNWNKLKEYIRKNIIYDDVGMKILDPSSLEDYIQELEQGSDSNE